MFAAKLWVWLNRYLQHKVGVADMKQVLGEKMALWKRSFSYGHGESAMPSGVHPKGNPCHFSS